MLEGAKMLALQMLTEQKEKDVDSKEGENIQLFAGS
jgi:hypothetical protein